MSRQTHRKRDVWLDIDISGNGSDCKLRMYGIADKTSGGHKVIDLIFSEI